jgi:hypothetical protein
VKRDVMSVAAVVVFAIAIALSAPALLGSSPIHSIGVPQSALARTQSAVSARNETASTPVSKAPSLQAFSKFRGFCQCSCSSIPNCNTSADCGGGTCSAFISCCAKPGKGGDTVAAKGNCNSAGSNKDEVVLKPKPLIEE